jgi:uncharacterized membrane protein
MRYLTIYYSNQDEQLVVVKQIQELCESHGLLFIDICVDNDPGLQKRIGDRLPVVMIGAYQLNFPFTISEVEVAARAALHHDAWNSKPVEDDKRFSMTRSERFALWFSKNYALVISIIIILFAGASVLPPVLAAGGNLQAANIGYRFYSLFCHQLAFRSYFIDGDQHIYPRALANIEELTTYEEITGRSAEDIKFAREIIGNEGMGYKLALCERDLAIYAGLGLFGLIFHFTGKKIKHLRWFYWLILAVIPIAIDGGSQLPGLAQGWPVWLPVRESTPLLRTITGGLFGIGTAWFVFPLMEESVSETRFALERKKKISIRYSAQQ